MKLWIFDLDGTVLDTLETIRGHVNKTLEEFGAKGITREEAAQILGNGPAYLIEKAMALSGLEREKFDQVLEKYLDNYDQDPIASTEVFAGMREVLAQLKSQGAKLALVSNKQDSAVKQIVDHFFEKDYFDLVMGERPDIKRKPSPDMVYYAMGKLKEKEAIIVGDTEVDLTTGKNAGIKTLAVSWGFRTKEFLEREKADYLANNIEDFKEILKEVL